MINNKFETVIIGAGNIGAFYDHPDSKDVLSHAHGINLHPEFELCGFIDCDEEILKRAASIWKTSGYRSLDEYTQCHQVDVVIIAVPDELHYEYLFKVLNFSPKLVILEKPIVTSLEDAKALELLNANITVQIIVNYSRRFESKYNNIYQLIQSNKLGRFTNGTGYYGKGILHNGSHLLDLLNYLIGEFNEFEFLGQLLDYKFDDPSISAILKYKHAQFYLQAIDSNYMTIFELDLFFEKGRIRISQLGKCIEIFTPKESDTLKEYIFLETEERYHLDNSMAIINLYNHASNVLKSIEVPICSIQDGLKVFSQCIRLKDGIK